VVSSSRQRHKSLGQQGFGTRYIYPQNGILPDDDAEEVAPLPVDWRPTPPAWARTCFAAATYDDFVAALKAAQDSDRTTVIYIQNDQLHGVPGYESWWDVPIAEVSESATVRAAREEWDAMRVKERTFL
jgi:3D-(3,5/4)-trihydroxycyclohexane-1,2-dione acylhydrolase (decyclizing)